MLLCQLKEINSYPAAGDTGNTQSVEVPWDQRKDSLLHSSCSPQRLLIQPNAVALEPGLMEQEQRDPRSPVLP